MDLSNLPECAESRLPVMPNFAESTHGFAHTVDSAIPILERLGVPESNITLRMAGHGRPHLEIVRQLPRHGAELTPSVPVTLWVAGLGFFDALPIPMRESGGEAGMGTREICQVFDDPIQKAAQWFRAGSCFSRLDQADMPPAGAGFLCSGLPTKTGLNIFFIRCRSSPLRFPAWPGVKSEFGSPFW
jgi:hypothetical protein